MAIDVAKTALENLYALVATANGKPATPAHFTLAAPAVRVPDANARNTSVLATAVDGGGYEGVQTFTYTRLDIDALGGPLELQLQQGTTLADVLAWAVTQLGVIASEVEFTITELPAFVDETNGDAPTTEELVEVKAKAGSYAYIGTKAITLLAPVPEDEQLAAAYPTADLDGFVA